MCPTCGELAGRTWEVAYDADDASPALLPAAAAKLRVQTSDGRRELRVCDACGARYLYKSGTSTATALGTDDIVTLYESIEPAPAAAAAEPVDVAAEPVARCPHCHSTNVRCTYWYYGFSLMRCDACGHEQAADEYELEDWYRN